MKILPDGSVEGQTFSGENYKDEYPNPKNGKETFRQYRERVNQCVRQGFDLGDLGWDDWTRYCMGSGNYEGVDSDNIMK